MDRLAIELENCHGIRRLQVDLDFGGGGAIAIYAPNGTMKTSFARTVRDLSRGELTIDHMFPERPTKRVVVDESGESIDEGDVVVVLSYDEDLGPTEATSTLLVNSELRKEYETLIVDIEASRDSLVSALRLTSSSKLNVESEVSQAFTSDPDGFFKALLRVESELADGVQEGLADIPYDTVFNPKVAVLLEKDDFQSTLEEYVKRLNELLDASAVFDRETFNYYNGSLVTRALADNGFFDANHRIVLAPESASMEISTAAELRQLIDDEKAKISDDPELRRQLAEVERMLQKNAECRRFYDLIASRPDLLLLLGNPSLLKEELWKAYLKSNEDAYRSVLDDYRSTQARVAEIEGRAAEERTAWEEVVDQFNRRFFVPFRLEIKNREHLILGQERVPELDFVFTDTDEDQIHVQKPELLRVLSTGEKKALYILNVLFEVRRHSDRGKPTLFVIDDIADSFDYKNKYAIIQYLKEMAETPDFRLIILTHNFDFFRTLESRFVPYSNCRVAQRTEDGVVISQATGIRNPFIRDFKPGFFSSPMKRIASIPFMRNILEYTRGEEDPDYSQLTSLLHWKSDTRSITQGDLDRLFSTLFADTSGGWVDSDSQVFEMIVEQADLALSAPAGMNLEHKIVLSMAIRLKAERFMLDFIGEGSITDMIDRNQTQALYALCSGLPTGTQAILDSVVLMTPENIHVNSFMYEPIIDMADDHLRRLYTQVSAISGG